MSAAIASKIIEIAKDKGKNLSELESDVSLSRGYVNRVRRGVIQEFKIGHITKIADILGVSINELIGNTISITKADIRPISYKPSLYDMIESFVKKELTDRKAAFFSSELYTAKYEIYKYCLEEKKGKFDENFAKFLLSRVGDIR